MRLVRSIFRFRIYGATNRRSTFSTVNLLSCVCFFKIVVEKITKKNHPLIFYPFFYTLRRLFQFFYTLRRLFQTTFALSKYRSCIKVLFVSCTCHCIVFVLALRASCFWVSTSIKFLDINFYTCRRSATEKTYLCSYKNCSS